jgi:hypothetical protein
MNTDFDTYTEAQAAMKWLRDTYGAPAIDLPEFQAAWRAAETIKNRHGGMPPAKPQPKRTFSKLPLLAVCLLAGFSALGADLTPAEINRAVDAIWRIEGGAATRYPYGIRSITTTNAAHARKICYNTVRNTWRRYEAAGKPGEWADYLANRFCPPAADKVGNANWKRNFKRIMGKAEK